jgi:hypothetical protein
MLMSLGIIYSDLYSINTLAKRMEIFANEILKQDNIKFRDITPKTPNSVALIEADRGGST